VGESVKYPPDLHLRSHRVTDGLNELRLARRLGRRLTKDEATQLSGGWDGLRHRQLALGAGARLVVRCGRIGYEWPARKDGAA